MKKIFVYVMAIAAIMAGLTSCEPEFKQGVIMDWGFAEKSNPTVIQGYTVADEYGITILESVRSAFEGADGWVEYGPTTAGGSYVHEGAISLNQYKKQLDSYAKKALSKATTDLKALGYEEPKQESDFTDDMKETLLFQFEFNGEKVTYSYECPKLIKYTIE